MGLLERRPEQRSAYPMLQRIVISAGTGEGPTPVAAFDAALMDAGIADYNLIPLSSVIPPGSCIEQGRFAPLGDEYGHRLYVVIARQDELCPGKEAWAGLGWIQEEQSGRGLFVELHGASQSQVEREIAESLEAMRATRSIAYGPVRQLLSGVPCRDKPVCAITAAVYRSEGWQ